MPRWLHDSLRCTCGDLPTQGRSELRSNLKILQRLTQETKLATFLKRKGPASNVGCIQKISSLPSQVHPEHTVQNRYTLLGHKAEGAHWLFPAKPILYIIPQIHGKRKKYYRDLYHRCSEFTAWWFWGFQPPVSWMNMESVNLCNVSLIWGFSFTSFFSNYWGQESSFRVCGMYRLPGSSDPPPSRTPDCRAGARFWWVGDWIWPFGQCLPHHPPSSPWCKVR